MLVLLGALIILLAAPSAAAPAGAEIVVTTVSDESNGDIRAAAALIANPGTDGISLREAIHATNNDPGSYIIRFASALAGATMLVGASPPTLALPPLTGGGVTIEGDIDGNGSPDVTLRPAPELLQTCCVHSGLQIASSKNRLHALAVEGFHTGVELEPAQTPQEPLPAHRTFADNIVSGLAIRGSHEGVLLQAAGCGMEKPPCPTYNRWTNTTITGNTIEPSGAGIHVTPNHSIGDRVEGLTVTENTIRPLPSPTGGSIELALGGHTTQSLISDVLIARNAIEAVGGGGIAVAAGIQRAQANTMERVRILDNRVHLVRRQPGQFCCIGIDITAGGDTFAVNDRPINYPDRNLVKNLQVAGNSITGSLIAGVNIQAGVTGGSHNHIENVRIHHNVIRSTLKWARGGVYVLVGENFASELSETVRPATGNRVTELTIDANRITSGKGKSRALKIYPTQAGIALLGGLRYAQRGVIRDVRIRRNRIAGSRFGVGLIGGAATLPAEVAITRGNRVSCVRLTGNRIRGAQKVVSVMPNLGGASGNRASLGSC
jgi:hypothetical protein